MHIAMVPHEHAGNGASCCADIRGTCLYGGIDGTERFLARNDSHMAVCKLVCILGGGCGRSRSGSMRDQ